MALRACLPTRWWDQHDRGQWIDFPFRPRSVKKNDLLLIYAAGTGKTVGVVRVTSDWYEGGNQPRWPYRVDVEVVKAVPVSQGVDLASFSREREIGKSIRQKSHVRLSSPRTRPVVVPSRLATRYKELALQVELCLPRLLSSHAP